MPKTWETRIFSDIKQTCQNQYSIFFESFIVFKTEKKLTATSHQVNLLTNALLVASIQYQIVSLDISKGDNVKAFVLAKV